MVRAGVASQISKVWVVHAAVVAVVASAVASPGVGAAIERTEAHEVVIASRRVSGDEDSTVVQDICAAAVAGSM